MDTEASSVGSFSGSGKDGSDYDKTDMEIHNQVHPIRADWKTGDRKSYASMVAGMQVRLLGHNNSVKTLWLYIQALLVPTTAHRIGFIRIHGVSGGIVLSWDDATDLEITHISNQFINERIGRPGDVGPWVLRGDTNVRASQVI
ncbi:hypothetical protein V6N11_021889 [Hibiscus sabdariffa]|uniref:Uncharacterized protein n=1 Tax=Hibiscus sabdariffa TaxID=183260 RepID=A0ABR2THZ9_9ROSI